MIIVNTSFLKCSYCLYELVNVFMIINKALFLLQLKHLCIITSFLLPAMDTWVGRRSTLWLYTYKATYREWQIPFYVTSFRQLDTMSLMGRSQSIACLREQLSRRNVFFSESMTSNDSDLWFCKSTGCLCGLRNCWESSVTGFGQTSHSLRLISCNWSANQPYNIYMWFWMHNTTYRWDVEVVCFDCVSRSLHFLNMCLCVESVQTALIHFCLFWLAQSHWICN